MNDVSKLFRVVLFHLVLVVASGDSLSSTVCSSGVTGAFQAADTCRIPDAAPRLRNLQGVSGNWSGYAIEPLAAKQQNGSITRVQGSWVVPEVVTTASDYTYSDIWVGIDGFNSNTVEQIGTAQDMTPGGPLFYAWYEMYPHGRVIIPNCPIQPGCKITASVEYIGNDQFKLSISSEIAGTTSSFVATERLKNAKRRSAEWIVEAPYAGGILPLANFGTATLDGCSATMSGHDGPIDDPAWHFEPLDMAVGNLLKADTLPLTSPSSFNVNWVNE